MTTIIETFATPAPVAPTPTWSPRDPKCPFGDDVRRDDVVVGKVVKVDYKWALLETPKGTVLVPFVPDTKGKYAAPFLGAKGSKRTLKVGDEVAMLAKSVTWHARGMQCRLIAEAKWVNQLPTRSEVRSYEIKMHEYKRARSSWEWARDARARELARELGKAVVVVNDNQFAVEE